MAESLDNSSSDLPAQTSEQSKNIENPETSQSLPDTEEALRVLMHASYSGPIPPSSELAAYEEIIPGAADRILKLTEKEADHRRQATNTHQINENQQIKRGQWFAFIIVLAAIVASVIIALTGGLAGAIGGSILGAAGLASIVAVMITRQAKSTAKTQHSSSE